MLYQTLLGAWPLQEPDQNFIERIQAYALKAVREAKLDLDEGADMLMVKPALPYLDVVRSLRDALPELPLFAYQVSGEYSMIRAAAERGYVDGCAVALESLLAIKRAGADAILIHSKRSRPDEILAFAREWAGRGPLVIVPTRYYSTPTDVFREAFSGVTPAKGRGPSREDARRNKAALLKVLAPHGGHDIPSAVRSFTPPAGARSLPRTPCRRPGSMSAHPPAATGTSLSRPTRLALISPRSPWREARSGLKMGVGCPLTSLFLDRVEVVH